MEVERHIFRNMLFPTGKAVYASPENLEENEEYLKVWMHDSVKILKIWTPEKFVVITLKFGFIID